MVPVLLSGFGRSGTTAIMSLLGTDARVAFDRIYPFEHRYLTFLAKQAILAARNRPPSIHDGFRMCNVDDCTGTTQPWWPTNNTLLSLASIVTLSTLWNGFVNQLKLSAPIASFYAEKSPYWLPDQLRDVADLRVIHLVRDPRDVYLSVRAFAHSKGQTDAANLAGDLDDEQARDMAHQLSCFAEAERSDRQRRDAVLIRYEDWVSDNMALATRLSHWLGLTLNANAEEVNRNVGQHRTSKDVASSKGRWHRESLPAVVENILLPALGNYGTDYGYDLPLPTADLTPRADLTHSADAGLSNSLYGVQLTINGPDAWIEMLETPVEAQDISEVWASIRGTTGDNCTVYWCHDGEQYDEARAVHLPFYPGPHIQILRFAVQNHASWDGTIHRLRIDVCNGNVNIGSVVDVHWVRLVR